LLPPVNGKIPPGQPLKIHLLNPANFFGDPL